MCITPRDIYEFLIAFPGDLAECICAFPRDMGECIADTCCCCCTSSPQRRYRRMEMDEEHREPPHPVYSISEQIKRHLPPNFDVNRHPELPRQITVALSQNKPFEVRMGDDSLPYVYFPSTNEPGGTVDLLTSLLDEILLNIFSFLDPADIHRLRLVSKRFSKLARDPRVFAIFLKKCYPHYSLSAQGDFKAIWLKLRKPGSFEFKTAKLNLQGLPDPMKFEFRPLQAKLSCDQSYRPFPAILSTYDFPPLIQNSDLLNLLPLCFPLLQIFPRLKGLNLQQIQMVLQNIPRLPAVVIYASNKCILTVHYEGLESIRCMVWNIESQPQKTTEFSVSFTLFPIIAEFKAILAAGLPITAGEVIHKLSLPEEEFPLSIYEDCKGKLIILYCNKGCIYRIDENGLTLLVDLQKNLKSNQFCIPKRHDEEACLIYKEVRQHFLLHFGEGGRLLHHSPIDPSVQLPEKLDTYFDPKFNALLVWDTKPSCHQNVYTLNLSGDCTRIYELGFSIDWIKAAIILDDLSILVISNFSATHFEPNGKRKIAKSEFLIAGVKRTAPHEILRVADFKRGPGIIYD